MSAQTHSPDTGVTPSPDSGGVTPTQTPTDTGVTPSQSSSLSPASETRDANADGNLDESREAALDRAELQKALKAERHRSREMERALKALQDAEKTRTDAEKSEIERATSAPMLPSVALPRWNAKCWLGKLPMKRASRVFGIDSPAMTLARFGPTLSACVRKWVSRQARLRVGSGAMAFRLSLALWTNSFEGLERDGANPPVSLIERHARQHAGQFH
jgi:hypothetical protein